MHNYNVYLDDEIIGSVNLSNCNCSKFMYLGTDHSGNTMVYKPGLHTIKECLLDSTPALTGWRNGSHTAVAGDSCSKIANEFCDDPIKNEDLQKVICDFSICNNLQIGNIVDYDYSLKKTNCPPTPAPSNKSGTHIVKQHETCNTIATTECGDRTSPDKVICDYSDEFCKHLKLNDTIYYDCGLLKNHCPTSLPPSVVERW